MRYRIIVTGALYPETRVLWPLRQLDATEPNIPLTADALNGMGMVEETDTHGFGII